MAANFRPGTGADAMAPRLILTTRSIGDAARDVAYLEERGGRAISSPMLEIKPLSPKLPDAGEFDSVVLTSRHAAAALAASAFLDLDCYCVGEATATAAGTAGFSRVKAGPGDGEGLAEFIGRNPPRRVFWAAGLDIGFDMAAALKSFGIEVVQTAVYEAVKAEDLTPEALGKVKDGEVGVVLVHSGRAGGHFSHLLERHGMQDRRGAMTLVAVSQGAAGLCGEGWHTIRTVESPLRAAVLDTALDAAGQDRG